jgi:arsenate reductase-like glutaredoxin family protein
MGDRPPEDIRLFTQTGCADSRRVRDWLTDRGVAFVERNVTSDIDAAKELLATRHFGTPLLVFAEETVIGFNRDRLAAVLANGLGDE